MAREQETTLAEAESSLRRGIDRSRGVVARYRSRLLLLREAMQRQNGPQLAGGRAPGES